MKIVIATDSFKGSLTSKEAGDAIKEGIISSCPAAVVEVFEAADGGEGTLRAIVNARKGRFVNVTVTGPLGRPVSAAYGIIGSPLTAVIDSSEACGLTLVPPDKRDPLYTTTAGVGELIKDALDKGCRRFIIGLGGSSTNDCGAGMLQSLGAKLLDEDGNDIRQGAIGLSDLQTVDLSGLDGRTGKSEFLIACDVKNPLTGPSGCSFVFAPQKGADKVSCQKMDKWIGDFAKLFEDADSNFPGAGAAGGLGFALRTCLNGRMMSGAGLVLEQIGLEDAVKDADIMITGEGRLDAQTVMGKLPFEAASLAKRYGVRTIAFAGKTEAGEDILHECGIDEVYSISEGISEQESMANAAALLKKKACEVMRGRSI